MLKVYATAAIYIASTYTSDVMETVITVFYNKISVIVMGHIHRLLIKFTT